VLLPPHHHVSAGCADDRADADLPQRRYAFNARLARSRPAPQVLVDLVARHQAKIARDAVLERRRRGREAEGIVPAVMLEPADDQPPQKASPAPIRSTTSTSYRRRGVHLPVRKGDGRVRAFTEVITTALRSNRFWSVS